jgi:hypothetical protein
VPEGPCSIVLRVLRVFQHAAFRSVNVIPFFGVQGYEGARMRESTSARVMGDGDCDDYFSGSTRVPRRSHIALSLAMVFVVAGGLLAGNSHTIHPGYATGKGRCLP